MIGSLINAAAIILGTLIGIFIGKRFSNKMRQTIIQSLGLIVLSLGIQMMLQSNNFMIVILSLVLGALIGEWIDIEKYITKVSDYLAQKTNSDSANTSFSQGFLTATLLYCVGAMAILGAIQEGIQDDFSILLTKSILDGISAIFFAATFGWGVLFSFIPVFLYQGAITLLSTQLISLFTESVIAELTSTGGIILIGIALSILEIKTIRTANLLPAIPLAILLALFI